MKTKLIVVLVLALGGFATFWWQGNQNATINQAYFGGLNRKKLKKAHRKMCVEALTGKYDPEVSDEANNRHLLEIYNTL